MHLHNHLHDHLHHQLTTNTSTNLALTTTTTFTTYTNYTTTTLTTPLTPFCSMKWWDLVLALVTRWPQSTIGQVNTSLGSRLAG